MMTPEQQARYNERMKRKKAVVDAKIAKATEERGVLILLRWKACVLIWSGTALRWLMLPGSSGNVSLQPI